MSSKDSNSAANGLPSDSELASLAALLKAEEESGDDADKNLAGILARLENADSIARQMESNLDRLLERLDGMVQGLEAAQTEENVALDDRHEENASSQPQQNGQPEE